MTARVETANVPRALARPATQRQLVVLTVAAIALLVAGFAFEWSRTQNGGAWDDDVYERYGALMESGELPYRDFRVEYPPGGLLVFVLPSLVTEPSGQPVWEPVMNDSARQYARAFGLEMIALLAATIGVTSLSLYALRAPLGRAGIALGLLALSPFLLGDLVYTRFDALPMLLTAAALAALLRARFRLSGTALGLGVATKLYPALLAPLAVSTAWRLRGRREGLVTLGVTALAALAVFVPFVLLSPGGTWWPLHAQLTRGLQAESIGASALSALHVFTFQLQNHGIPMWVFPLDLVESAGRLKSAEVQGLAGRLVGGLSTLLSVAALAWAWTAYARGAASPERLVRFTALVLTVQLTLGRVLSPQFLIWLLPVVPLVRGRRGLAASGVLAAALALTHVWFPGPYRDYVNNVVSGEIAPLSILLARNALLLALLAVLALPVPARLRASRA